MRACVGQARSRAPFRPFDPDATASQGSRPAAAHDAFRRYQDELDDRGHAGRPRPRHDQRRQAFGAICRAGVRALDGPPASLIVAARRLADHVPVRLGVLTKAERGALIGENKLHRVHKAVPLDVRAGMTIAEAFQAIVHACLKHYRLNEPLVIRKSKVEALHQTRVAMRRLRSAFSLFKPAIEDVEYQHLRHQLRWFTAQLGDARNIDVYLQRDLDEEERARLMPKRESAYDRVVDAMNSHKFRRLLIDLVGWTAMGTWRSSRIAQRSVEGFANRRLTGFGSPLPRADAILRRWMKQRATSCASSRRRCVMRSNSSGDSIPMRLPYVCGVVAWKFLGGCCQFAEVEV